MHLIQNLQKFDAKLEKLPLIKDCSSSEKALRKYFIYGQAGYIYLTVSVLIICSIMSISIFVQYSIVGLLFGTTISLALLFIKTKTTYLVLAMKIGMIAIAFYYSARLGGILTSGGIILMGIAPVLYTLIFKKYKWVILIFGMYFSSVLLLFILDNWLPGKTILTHQQNLFLFFIFLLGITSYIFIFALYAQNIFTGFERRETERQKEINDAKTRLYTNITHEFRTPLTVILGMAETLTGIYRDEVHIKADAIIRNGKSVLQLVDKMLDMSKLESGRIEINMIRSNIVPFFRYIFHLQEYYALEKNLQFDFDTASQSYILDFDPEKITMIVSNLLSNAIKFTPPGGKISMSVKVDNDWLIIEVIDNGIGIPQEKQDRIFDRFYQIDDKDTRKAGGAGLGLALTKELVELMSGEIVFHSEPDKETVFKVRLPSKDVSTASNGVGEIIHNDDLYSENELKNEAFWDDGTETDSEKQKILIIEDNKDVVSYLIACYNIHFSIDIAYDGEQGFAKAVKTIPDVIVSDIMMPGMDGFTLCRKVKDDYRTSHIPVILLTAKEDIPSRIRGLEEGADAYLVKPFNKQELLVRINKLIELRKKLHKRYRKGDPIEKADDQSFFREDQFINKVTDLVEKSLHDEYYNVQVLCEEMAMSKSQLYRKFKALTNMSAAKYIRKLRLEKARHLLLTTYLNITEISNEVGMKTLSTFSQLFKEEYGYSPKEYARRVHDN